MTGRDKKKVRHKTWKGGKRCEGSRSTKMGLGWYMIKLSEKQTSAPCLVVEEVVVGHENDIGRLVALPGHVVGTEAVLLTCTIVVPPQMQILGSS
jgi:hypothetical protein